MLAFGTHSAITHNCSDTFAGAITSYMEWTRYTLFDLESRLAEFENMLREAKLRETTIRICVDRTQIFLDWLAGRYCPRGPVQR